MEVEAIIGLGEGLDARLYLGYYQVQVLGEGLDNYFKCWGRGWIIISSVGGGPAWMQS